MLIEEEIEAEKASGVLIPARPIVDWAGEPRVFLKCKGLHEEIEKGKLDLGNYDRWASLEADMSHFVEGGWIDWNFMKWLDPKKYEHWELKSVRPAPSLRVFGRFALPDVFVGTHVVPRPSLAGKWSPQFEHEKLVCEDFWNKIFTNKPFSGATYEDYITENAARTSIKS